jgi:DNA-binding transcriptional LysR family regulator
VAQPSLSHTIRQLEEQVGFTLFERSTRSTKLTSDGARFLTEAAAVMKRYDEAMALTTQIARGELGRLRVGYLIGAAVDHLPMILRAFGEAYPEVKLDLMEYDFASPNVGLDVRATDVAIVRPPLNGVTDVVLTPLLEERCFVCLPSDHRFASLRSVDVMRLLEEPMIAAPGSGEWRDAWMLNHLRQEPARVLNEAATFEAELRAVAVGRGISIVPEIAPRLYSRPGVAFVRITGLPPCEVAVVHHREAPRAALNFAEIARRVVEEAGVGRTVAPRKKPRRASGSA